MTEAERAAEEHYPAYSLWMGKPVTEVRLRREGFLEGAKWAEERKTATERVERRISRIWQTAPPAPWSVFGTHADTGSDVKLEFWGEEFSEDGLPIWERPAFAVFADNQPTVIERQNFDMGSLE